MWFAGETMRTTSENAAVRRSSGRRRVGPAVVVAGVLTLGFGSAAMANQPDATGGGAVVSTGSTGSTVNTPDEPISRDKVIVIDGPAARATVAPDADPSPTETPFEAEPQPEQSATTGEATTARPTSIPTPTATPSTGTATTNTATSTATSTATATQTASSTATRPAATTRAKIAEAPLRPRPWTPYPVPADTSESVAPVAFEASGAASVPVLAKGMKGTTAALPVANQGPVIDSTTLGLFGLSLVVAGGTLLAVIRAHARR